MQWRHMTVVASQITSHSIVFFSTVIQTEIKGNIKGLDQWPLWGEFTDGFPSQRVSNAESTSMWRLLHEMVQRRPNDISPSCNIVISAQWSIEALRLFPNNRQRHSKASGQESLDYWGLCYVISIPCWMRHSIKFSEHVCIECFSIMLYHDDRVGQRLISVAPFTNMV